MDRLTPAQMDSILAHELCHVRRRDNLTAAIHMVVETIFLVPSAGVVDQDKVDRRTRSAPATKKYCG